MPAFNPTDTALQAWKRQIDTALRIAEAFVEGAERAREIQLSAAVEAHAWLEANRKALAGEAGPGELVALQSRLATENLGKMAEYWTRLAANARDTQARIVAVLTDGTALPQAPGAQDALNAIVDAGYKQWIETLKRLYSLPQVETKAA
jgi:hypothetical protein